MMAADIPREAMAAAQRAFPAAAPHALRAALEAAAPQLTSAAEHGALCWEQTDDGRLIACDRMKDHKGGHSWEAADAVAAERKRCAQLAQGEAAKYRAVGEDWANLGAGALEDFAALLREQP